jgi:hypothetical protein
MSTDMKRELKEADQRLLQLEKQLPFGTRFRRRYLSGRMYVATQLFELKGRIEGFLLAGVLVGKGFWPMLATKFPVAAALVVGFWDHVVEFTQAVVLVVTNSD